LTVAVLDVENVDPHPPLEWWVMPGARTSATGQIKGVVSLGSPGVHGWRRVSLTMYNSPRNAWYGSVRTDPVTGEYCFRGVSPRVQYEVIAWGGDSHRTIVHGPITVTGSEGGGGEEEEGGGEG
jgi:hypothetical protein